MQRIPILIIFFFTAAASLQAQTFPKRTCRVQLGLPIVPALNVHVENRLGGNFSLVAKAEAHTLFGVSSALGTTGSIAYVPSVEVRWFYNVERRLKKGRSIEKFSGNFFSAEPFAKIAETKYGDYIFYLPPLYPDAGIFFNYGMQRGFGRHGHWGFVVGCAPIAVLDDSWNPIVKINFQIGLQW